MVGDYTCCYEDVVMSTADVNVCFLTIKVTIIMCNVYVVICLELQYSNGCFNLSRCSFHGIIFQFLLNYIYVNYIFVFNL